MTAEIWFVAVPLIAVAGCLAWAAHQIYYKGRIDLVRLGSGPLPGAHLLRGQFAALVALQGVLCAAVAAMLVYTGECQPWVWLFAGCSAALAARRGLLVRALEIHAN